MFRVLLPRCVTIMEDFTNLLALSKSVFDTIQKLVKTKNQLIASMTSLKFEYIDLEKVNSDLMKENSSSIHSNWILDVMFPKLKFELASSLNTTFLLIMTLPVMG